MRFGGANKVRLDFEEAGVIRPSSPGCRKDSDCHHVIPFLVYVSSMGTCATTIVRTFPKTSPYLSYTSLFTRYVANRIPQVHILGRRARQNLIRRYHEVKKCVIHAWLILPYPISRS